MFSEGVSVNMLLPGGRVGSRVTNIIREIARVMKVFSGICGVMKIFSHLQWVNGCL